MGSWSVRRWIAGLAACALAATLAACGASATEMAPYPKKLVFDDEFNGAAGALPDPANWGVVQMADASGDEQECYTDSPDNVATDGQGHLVISAVRRAGNCADGWYRYVTSGRITTQGLHSWKYGRLEVRAKVPDGVGSWPSFWAMGDVADPFGTWPRSGEIDVMETVGSDPHHLIGTIHGPRADGQQYFLQGHVDTPQPLGDAFHTYGVVWNRDGMTWSLDGQVYGKVTRQDAEDAGDWVFDQKFFLILNLAVGGVLGGVVPPSTVFPQQLVVDWVRVYQ